MVVGCISSDTINEVSQKALQDGAIHFMPYVHLMAWEGSGSELLKDIEKITQNLAKKVDYPLDGMVVEIKKKVKNVRITNHHNGKSQSRQRRTIKLSSRKSAGKQEKQVK